MHFIPENERTDKNLLSLLDFYSLVLNHDSHVLREAWLQLFTTFKQPDVCPLQRNQSFIHIHIHSLLVLD